MVGRGVIVTGGFGALGQVVAASFAAAGDQVARVDFAENPPTALPDGLDIGGADLTDAAAASRVINEVVQKFGRLDVLVNIAGGFAWETLADGDLTTWQKMFAMNVLTAATISKAALPALRKAPAAQIINMGAGAAIRSDTGRGAYAASKAGVHRLTESLADELAGSSVTVNAILPSIIDTPANRADMPDADPGEWVKPQAIADAMLFLASDAARAITGALIPVTRGTSD